MTDQELAQLVADRLRDAEAAASETGDRRRLAVLRVAHRHLDRAWEHLQPEMDFAPLSGSPIKP